MVRDREEPNGNYLLARGISPGTFERLHVTKLKMGCKTWKDFMGRALEVFERNLGR